MAAHDDLPDEDDLDLAAIYFGAFYLFVANAPAYEIDVLGLWQMINCRSDDKKKIEMALLSICYVIQNRPKFDCCFATNTETLGLMECLKRKCQNEEGTITCLYKDDKDKGWQNKWKEKCREGSILNRSYVCGRGQAPGKNIWLCFPLQHDRSKCNSNECTLIHELTHNCGSGAHTPRIDPPDKAEECYDRSCK